MESESNEIFIPHERKRPVFGRPLGPTAGLIRPCAIMDVTFIDRTTVKVTSKSGTRPKNNFTNTFHSARLIELTK